MKKYLIMLISLLILTTGCMGEVEKDNTAPVITYEEAQEIIKTNKNVYIIDVRTKEEYNSYHVKDAINIPSGDIERIREHDISKDDYLILYCQGGRRSSESGVKLKEMGYKNVYDSGSINDWMKVE